MLTCAATLESAMCSLDLLCSCCTVSSSQSPSQVRGSFCMFGALFHGTLIWIIRYYCVTCIIRHMRILTVEGPLPLPLLFHSIFVSLYRLVSQPQCLSLILPSFSVRYFQSISLVLTVRGWQISQV